MTSRDSTPESERHARKGWSFFSPPPSTEKCRQCLVEWASFYHSLAKTMFLADLIDFQHNNFTAFFQVTKKKAVSASVGLSTLPIRCCWVGTFFVKVLFHGHGVVAMGGGAATSMS